MRFMKVFESARHCYVTSTNLVRSYISQFKTLVADEFHVCRGYFNSQKEFPKGKSNIQPNDTQGAKTVGAPDSFVSGKRVQNFCQI